MPEMRKRIAFSLLQHFAGPVTEAGSGDPMVIEDDDECVVYQTALGAGEQGEQGDEEDEKDEEAPSLARSLKQKP